MGMGCKLVATAVPFTSPHTLLLFASGPSRSVSSNTRKLPNPSAEKLPSPVPAAGMMLKLGPPRYSYRYVVMWCCFGKAATGGSTQPRQRLLPLGLQISHSKHNLVFYTGHMLHRGLPPSDPKAARGLQPDQPSGREQGGPRCSILAKN